MSCRDPGEYLEISHVVGDSTSELELRELDIRVTVRNRNKAAVCDSIRNMHLDTNICRIQTIDIDEWPLH